MLDTVVLGAKVLLRDMEYEKNEVYSIVNVIDANSLKNISMEDIEKELIDYIKQEMV